MNENSEEELLGAGLVGPGAESGTQQTLVLGEGPFDMNPMPIDAGGESALQLAAKAGRRPFPRAARVDGDHQGADADISAELVVRFAVVRPVGEESVPLDPQGAVQDGRSELGGVVGGPLTYLRRQPQVTGGMTQDGQFGVGRSKKGLGVGLLAAVVNADMPRLVARGIDRSFGFRPDQAATMGSITDRIEESIEAPFFRRRL